MHLARSRVSTEAVDPCSFRKLVVFTVTGVGWLVAPAIVAASRLADKYCSLGTFEPRLSLQPEDKFGSQLRFGPVSESSAFDMFFNPAKEHLVSKVEQTMLRDSTCLYTESDLGSRCADLAIQKDEQPCRADLF